MQRILTLRREPCCGSSRRRQNRLLRTLKRWKNEDGRARIRNNLVALPGGNVLLWLLEGALRRGDRNVSSGMDVLHRWRCDPYRPATGGAGSPRSGEEAWSTGCLLSQRGRRNRLFALAYLFFVGTRLNDE